MAIEFPCASCGQLVRTPEAAAGKKGKCPSCGLVQRIPGGPVPAAPVQPAPKPEKKVTEPLAAKTPVAKAPVGSPSPTPDAASGASAAPVDRQRPTVSELIRPDPPSLTPTPDITPAPSPLKAAEPKLPTQPGAAGKGASQWTSYVKRGAESIRPSSMPPADPRVTPRPQAKPQVLPPLEPRPKAPPADEPHSPTAEKAAPPPEKTEPTEAPTTPPPADKLEFRCPSCGAINRAPLEMADKKGRCPQCRSVLTIPSIPRPSTLISATDSPSSDVPKTASEPISPRRPPESATPAPRPSIAPHPDPISNQDTASVPVTSGKKWETAPSVAEEALTPIPADEEDLPELTPLTPEQIAALAAAHLASAAPALTPLGPAGLTPIEAIPDGGPDNYLTAAPVGYAVPGPVQARWTPAAHYRRGLPWERHTSIGPLIETLVTVAFNPGAAFRDMWQSGGMPHAVGYAAIMAFFMAVVTGITSMIYLAAIGAFNPLMMRPPGMGPFQPSLQSHVFPVLMRMTGRLIATNFGNSVFQLSVSTAITSGLTHGLMLLFGGARGGFGTTFRVFLYCMASTALLQFVPCGGIWVASVWTLIILMVGMSSAHDASGLSAAGAVFLGVGVYYALLSWILSLFSRGSFAAPLGLGF